MYGDKLKSCDDTDPETFEKFDISHVDMDIPIIHVEKDETKLKNEINKIITKYLGPIAKADKIQFVENLPKTRSGKIMRRILRKIANNDDNNLGDISTLVDPSVVKEIKKNVQ